MKIAALADLHLGFRAFTAVEDGRNVRELDVERAWSAAVDQVVEYRPDVVTIAGDIFHHPRVSDFAKKAFLDGVRRMVKAGHHVIVLQGNHDAGKTADVLTPIMLADGHHLVHIVTTPKRIKLDLLAQHSPDGDVTCETVSVACFPYVSRGNGEKYTLEPDPNADVNILLMHAAVRGAGDGDKLPFFYGSEQSLDITREAERWDVIALGDYHTFTCLHPTRPVFYSGSIERTSSNIWQEEAPKGWASVDTDTGELEFHEIPTRRMATYDLGDFNLPPGAPVNEVNGALAQLAGYGITPGSILRFKVDGFPREEKAQIDRALEREIQRHALHFYLDLRHPKRESRVFADRRERSPGATLLDDLIAFTEDEDEEVRALMAEHLGLLEEAQSRFEPEEIAV